ncbi:MAG TPA: MerR family transcriptional regulator [Acidimicrobiales bacterium]|nr:MerR family transcriptional regulator [Acidimicrobiales bacterium]
MPSSPLPVPPPPPPAGGEYRIDELAGLAGTAVRNVRAYQDRGLLPPPRRQGRIALYDQAHLTRLRLIGGLLARGYTLTNIAELVAAWEEGRDLREVLGVAPGPGPRPAGEEGTAESTRRRLMEAGVPAAEVRALGATLAEAVAAIAERYGDLAARYHLPEAVDTELALAFERRLVSEFATRRARPAPPPDASSAG